MNFVHNFMNFCGEEGNLALQLCPLKSMLMLYAPGLSLTCSAWSPGREKPEDAYVQGDPASAPPDLRLSRL